jgi:hypothetical protein
MKRPLPLILLVAALPFAARAALDAQAFPFTRPLEGPAVSRATPVAVSLDAAFFEAADSAFGDARIVDDSGLEIPRSIERVTTNTTRLVRHPVASTAVALQELPDNRIVAEFALTGTNACADGVDIRTPLHDFVRAVTVEGRAGNGPWQPLAPDGTIFDYRRYLDVRQTELALPGSACTAFRLTLSNASEERAQPLIHLMRQSGGRDAGAETRGEDLLRTPFRMDGVAFWRNETVIARRQPILREWDVAPPAIRENARDKTTEYILETRRAPVTQLVLEGSARNFSRQVRIEIPVTEQGRDHWRGVSSARIFNAELPGYARDSRTVDFPEQRVSRLRLVIANGDNPPLADVRLRAFGPAYHALLLAEPGRSYRLLYGAKDMPVPSYDLEAVLAPARLGLRPVEWRLGAVQANGGYTPGWGDWKRWLDSRGFLTAVIVLAAAGLLALLARTLRHVGEVDK